MPTPEPTTPGDATACACHHGGGSLTTTDFKPFGLGGGQGNEVLFLKSRSGNLICLDDHGFTVRLQDKTGNAEISLEAETIYIKQKTGDISFKAEKEIRFDCKNFEVHASNDISFNAGTDILHNNYSETKIDSGKSTTLSADKEVEVVSYNSFDGKAMSEISAAGKKKTSVSSKGSMNWNALGKISIISKQDLGVLSKSMLTVTGVKSCDFKSNAKVTLKASGPIIGMAMCININ